MKDSTIDQVAERILEKHWDGHLPVDPVRIAQSMGVEVRLHDFSDETIVNTGLINGKPVIILNRKTHEAGGTRPHFAVAHALGHIELHAKKLEPIEDVGEAFPRRPSRHRSSPRP